MTVVPDWTTGVHAVPEDEVPAAGSGFQVEWIRGGDV